MTQDHWLEDYVILWWPTGIDIIYLAYSNLIKIIRSIEFNNKVIHRMYTSSVYYWCWSKLEYVLSCNILKCICSYCMYMSSLCNLFNWIAFTCHFHPQYSWDSWENCYVLSMSEHWWRPWGLKLMEALICFLTIFFYDDVYSRPSVLDNFALLSGQLNTINKLLKSDKTPSFRNQVIIPLLLSPDRDEDLAVSFLSLFGCERI